MACRFGWCDTPATIHADDVSHHTRDLGHGMLLTVDTNGMPITNWMPDWQEWWINKPEEIDTEYGAVATMLCDLPKHYREFREELINDPVFADEVIAMKAKDARETNR